MPFQSKAQRRYFYAKLPHLAKKWEEHTPKGESLPEHKKLRKKAFMVGFFGVLEKAAQMNPLPFAGAEQQGWGSSTAGPEPLLIPTSSPRSLTRMILNIIRDPTIPKAEKNVLISRLEDRPQAALDAPDLLGGAGLYPMSQIVLQSHMQRAEQGELAPSLKKLLNLGILSQDGGFPPLLGLQSRIVDRRRRPEQEWRSQWKTTPV